MQKVLGVAGAMALLFEAVVTGVLHHGEDHDPGPPPLHVYEVCMPGRQAEVEEENGGEEVLIPILRR